MLDSKSYGIALPFGTLEIKFENIFVNCNFMSVLRRIKIFTGSPYRTMISKSILKLQEKGMLEQLKAKWYELMNQDLKIMQTLIGRYTI